MKDGFSPKFFSNTDFEDEIWNSNHQSDIDTYLYDFGDM